MTCSRSWRSPTSSTPPTSCARCMSAPPARTVSSVSRCRRRSSHDTDATVAMARTLWERVDRPNLMIKIPATLDGDARHPPDARVTDATSTSRSSSRSRCTIASSSSTSPRSRHAIDAGQPLDVHSVASFFVSRVDTLVDKLLEAKLAADPGNALLEGLLGKAAIANAVLAYELFEQRFNDDRFDRLRAAGAHVQRPLWASTSAKNPNYRDVVYAEALIGPDTVDTMPPGDHRRVPRSRRRRGGHGRAPITRARTPSWTQLARGRHRHGRGDPGIARRRASSSSPTRTTR